MESKLSTINQDEPLLKAAFPPSSHQPQQLSEDKNSLISMKEHPKLRDKLSSLKHVRPF